MRSEDSSTAARGAFSAWGFATRLAPRLCLCLTLGALIAGCASTTDSYRRPEVATPAAFKEGALWQQANPQAAEVGAEWWRLFKDPALDGLQARLVVDNQTLRASQAQYRVAQAALARSQSALFPTLGLSAAADRSRARGGSAGDGFSLSGSASWEIDLWGRVAATVDNAGASLQASQADVAAVRLSLQATLVQTYHAMRAAEVQAALLESSLGSYQRSLELTQNRYSAGVASAADVAQAQTQYKTTQAQLIEVRASRAQLEHALATLVGQPAAGLSLATTAQLPAPPEVPLQVPSHLLERRPDIAAAERRVAAANAQIGVAQAAFFPALTLSANGGFRNDTLSGLFSAPNLFWSLGPALALALLDGGARQAGIDSARASTDQATANYRQTVLSAFQEVEDNLVLATSLQAQAEAQNEAMVAARRALEIATNQYQAGTVSYLNVVTAQAAALSSERNLLDLRTRRLAAINQLLKNLAGSW